MKQKIFFIRIVDNKSYVLINAITIKKSQKTIKLGTKTFAINSNKPTFYSEKNHYFVIDYDNAAQLSFNSTESSITPEQIDLMLSNKIIKELTSGIAEDRKGKIVNFAFGCVFGGLVATIVALILYQTAMKDLYDNVLGLVDDKKETIPILQIGVKMLWQLMKMI